MYVCNKMSMQGNEVRTVYKTKTDSCTTLSSTPFHSVFMLLKALRMSYASVRCFSGKALSCRTYKPTSEVTASIVTLRRSTDLGPCAPGTLDCRTGSLHLGRCIRALCAPHWNSFLPSSPEALRTHRRERPLLAREGN
jgi:hypothetical protein